MPQARASTRSDAEFARAGWTWHGELQNAHGPIANARGRVRECVVGARDDPSRSSTRLVLGSVAATRVATTATTVAAGVTARAGAAATAAEQAAQQTTATTRLAAGITARITAGVTAGITAGVTARITASWLATDGLAARGRATATAVHHPAEKTAGARVLGRGNRKQANQGSQRQNGTRSHGNSPIQDREVRGSILLKLQLSDRIGEG